MDVTKIAISSRAALPLSSLWELAGRKGVVIYQLMGLGQHPLYGSAVPVYTLFMDAGAREAPNVSYIPCAYADAEALLRSIEPDMAILACALRSGFLSWGTSWDVSDALYDCAGEIILEVNDHMPFTGPGVPLGRGQLRWESYPLPEYHSRTAFAGEIALDIARQVAGLIPDGVALQIGVGTIPELVCLELAHMGKRVSIWTEAFGDHLMALCERGLVIGQPVCSFLWGSQRLYEWADGADLDMRPLREVNLGQGLTGPLWSVNGALEVDLQGNVNAEVLNGRQYSGAGGHADFVQLARRTGGRSVVALPSRARHRLRIVDHVQHVTTGRAYTDLVVTERGIADLWGLSLGERAAAIDRLA